MGGAQRFLYELITHLDNNKYEIIIAAGNMGERNELFERLSKNNIKTAEIKNFSNIFGFKNFLAFIEIFWLIAKFDPDVLYLLSSEAGFSGSIAGSLYRLLFWQKNPKIIYRIGGWAFKEPKNIIIKKIYLWAEKISAPFKDIIITNSEFDRQLAIKNRIAKPEKIITIYNGLDINKLEFLPKEEAKKFIKSKNGILIGTIANLYKNKGLDFLILAAARIKKSQPDCRFIIIGSGPEKQKLENLIKKYGLEDYVFLIGRIPNACQYLKAFNLFVLSSIKEGQPWTILEAMAAEMPIVATNIAGIPETIENEKSGILVEPADSTALAEAIEKMLTHPSLAQECAKNTYLTVKTKFGIDEMTRKNEELF